MINKIWNSVSLLGVEERYAEENSLTILYNRISFFSVIMLILFSIFLFIVPKETLFGTITFAISLVYALVLILNGAGKIYWARFCASFGTVSWVSIYHICFGGFISQSLAVGAAIIINYVAFRKKQEYMKLLFAVHAGVYLMALVFGINFGPIVEFVDYPISSLVSFIISMGWVTVFLIAFHRERETLILNLKAKNDELERTTNELERFSYIASHDLKSPLRTIVSFGGLIKRDIDNKNYQEVSEKMDYVITGAHQMNAIIQGILELNRLKSINPTERLKIDLNAILEKAKFHLMEEISQKNAKIQADPLPTLFGNEVEFLLLFQNLIQNSIKYNESSEPTVMISSQQTDDLVSISFQDNGIGIEQRYFTQIFDFFKRLHNSSKYMGTGIGLGLCKRIVENYNGTIVVDSQIGQGTCFTINLPI